MDGLITIGKMARAININPRTLRFYEQVGLLTPSSRGENSYRLYSTQDLEKLKFIFRAKELGLTLEEIKSVLSLSQDGLCLSVRRQVGDLLTTKIQEIDARIIELQLLREEFQKFRSGLDSSFSDTKPNPSCKCLE